MLLQTKQQDVDNHLALAMVITNKEPSLTENEILSDLRRALRAQFNDARARLRDLLPEE